MPRMWRSAGTMAMQGGLNFSYKAPRVEVASYAGPAGPLRRLDAAAADRDLPLRARALRRGQRRLGHDPERDRRDETPRRPATAPGVGDYTYTGLALRDIRDGKIATITRRPRRPSTSRSTTAGKKETMTGEVEKLAALRLRRRRRDRDARPGARQGRQGLPRLPADDGRQLHGGVRNGHAHAHRGHERRRARHAPRPSCNSPA